MSRNRDQLDPRVSIGLPVYNAERYLDECLESLLGQTFEDFEVVISDNASTDGTEDACRRWAARDGRIRYHRADENRGAIWNFNRTFELSRGTYFKWAASDDRCLPTFLERCVETLDADQDVVWCHPLTRHIDEHGNLVSAEDDPSILDGWPSHSLVRSHDRLPRHHRGSERPSQRFEGVLLGTTWCSDSYGLVRSDALRKTRLVLPYYGAEKVLCGELALLGRFAEVPEVLFHQRIHPDASGSMKSGRGQQDFVAPGRRFGSTRLALLTAHFGSVRRIRLSLAERMRCLGVLTRYVAQFGKWRAVAKQVFRGASLATSRPETSPSHATTVSGDAA